MTRRNAARGLPLAQGARAGWCAGLALLAVACADPRFPPDADARFEPWVGRYAARSFMYGTDGPLRPSAETLSIVEIVPRGDRLMLEQKWCVYEGVVTFVLEGYLRYEFPSSLPPVTAEMVLDGSSFSTKLTTYTLGYQQEAPSACASSDRAHLSTEQSGLFGTCQCPADESTMPARAADCRVTDPDQDGLPGATFELLVSGATWTYQVVQEVRLRYLNGYRGRNGLYADLESNATTQLLKCSEPDLVPDCALRDPLPCPAKYNKSEFVPIDDDYDCRRVMAEKEGLFPSPIPMFPPACAAEL